MVLGSRDVEWYRRKEVGKCERPGNVYVEEDGLYEKERKNLINRG